MYRQYCQAGLFVQNRLQRRHIHIGPCRAHVGRRARAGIDIGLYTSSAATYRTTEPTF